MSRSQIIRLLYSLLMLVFGGLLVVIGNYPSAAQKGPLTELAYGLGLALIIAGIDNTFRIVAILRLETEETADGLGDRIHRLLLKVPFGTSGIRLVADVRKGYDGYYNWAVKTGRQDLFFGGRSVLHRIDADFRSRGIGSAEAVLARIIKSGASVRILFLNPQSDLIPRLAEEEGQAPKKLLADLAQSIGICRRLYEILRSELEQVHTNAHLEVRVYDEVPYFAYHNENEKIIVGFYFTSYLGSSTSAFEVLDTHTQEMFKTHFHAIFDRASRATLLELSRHTGSPEFNDELFDAVHHFLVQQLGADKTNEMMRKNHP